MPPPSPTGPILFHLIPTRESFFPLFSPICSHLAIKAGERRDRGPAARNRPELSQHGAGNVGNAGNDGISPGSLQALPGLQSCPWVGTDPGSCPDPAGRKAPHELLPFPPGLLLLCHPGATQGLGRDGDRRGQTRIPEKWEQGDSAGQERNREEGEAVLPLGSKSKPLECPRLGWDPPASNSWVPLTAIPGTPSCFLLLPSLTFSLSEHPCPLSPSLFCTGFPIPIKIPTKPENQIFFLPQCTDPGCPL